MGLIVVQFAVLCIRVFSFFVEAYEKTVIIRNGDYLVTPQQPLMCVGTVKVIYTIVFVNVVCQSTV